LGWLVAKLGVVALLRVTTQAVLPPGSAVAVGVWVEGCPVSVAVGVTVGVLNVAVAVGVCADGCPVSVAVAVEVAGLTVVAMSVAVAVAVGRGVAPAALTAITGK
jgi:hypothetical protein